MRFSDPSNDFDGAAPARVSGPDEARPAPFRDIKPGDMDTAEKQVSFIPSFGFGEFGNELVDRAVVKAMFDIQEPVFKMHPGSIDGVLGRHGKIQEINQHLKNGGSNPVGTT